MTINYNFEHNKSYLIYGSDFYHKYEITNMLLESIGYKYNEILYFDVTNHTNCITSKIPLVENDFNMNLFEYFDSKYLNEIDIQSRHRHLAAFLLKNTSKSPQDIQLKVLANLLEDIFRLESRPQNFSFASFIKLLDEIIEKSKSRTYKDFFKKLESIKRIKQEHPNDYTVNVEFIQLVQEVRIELETFLFSNTKEAPTLLINFENYIFNNETINIFTKLRNVLHGIGTDLNRYSSSTSIQKNKINYYRKDSINFDNDYIKFFLESLAYRKKNSAFYNKPLIFIQGIQKELFQSDFIRTEEIFKSADLCFIISNPKQLDKNVNSFVDVKFFDNKVKELSLKDQPTNTIKLEDNNRYFVSK